MGGTFRALVLDERDGVVSASVRELDEADLPEGEVIVAVEWSGLNYKDGMILKNLGRLVRRFPHVPGVDFAGSIAASSDPRFAPGDGVVLTGWRVGETRWGGYAERARVKADWLLPLPAGINARRAMAVGTAGLTAALALAALERDGLTAGRGELLVTGAAGGLGSIAVALAAGAGYRVVAATGRAEAHDQLRRLGAAAVIGREELAPPARPLESERWAAAIDAVGGAALPGILPRLGYRGAVAACGNAGGNDLATSLLPFLLRGVRIIGIDSVVCPNPERTAAWSRLARTVPAAVLDELTTVVGLADLPAAADRILAGQVRGRVLVDLRA